MWEIRVRKGRQRLLGLGLGICLVGDEWHLLGFLVADLRVLVHDVVVPEAGPVINGQDRIVAGRDAVHCLIGRWWFPLHFLLSRLHISLPVSISISRWLILWSENSGRSDFYELRDQSCYLSDLFLVGHIRPARVSRTHLTNPNGLIYAVGLVEEMNGCDLKKGGLPRMGSGVRIIMDLMLQRWAPHKDKSDINYRQHTRNLILSVYFRR